MTTAHDLDKILRKVQALIAKADGTDYPEEAAVFRAKAEALMHQYRIEESMLAQAAPVGTGLQPVWKTWRVCEYTNTFKDYYRQVASWVLGHVGGEGVFRIGYDNETGVEWLRLECVGFESDLRYGEMLLTSALLTFGERLEPKYNHDESDQVNAYRMRKAGMEGWKIAYMLWGDAKGLQPNPASVGRNAGKARRLYAAEARLRGENPNELMGQGTNVETYRNSYAQGFADEIYSRLSRMRISAGEGSQAMVLAGRKDVVKEAFYEKFPRYRPNDNTQIGTGAENCENCRKAKSGHCRRHPKPSKLKEQPTNWKARQRGQDAASTVNLGTTGRLTS